MVLNLLEMAELVRFKHAESAFVRTEVSCFGGDRGSEGDCDQSDNNTIDKWVSGYDVHYGLEFDLN